MHYLLIRFLTQLIERNTFKQRRILQLHIQTCELQIMPHVHRRTLQPLDKFTSLSLVSLPSFQPRHPDSGFAQGFLWRPWLDVPRADGQGRAVGMEVAVNTPRLAEAVADPDRTDTIPDIVADGAYSGMQTFDQHLVRLVLDGNPPRVQYLLTQKGMALEPAIDSLKSWARSWLD